MFCCRVWPSIRILRVKRANLNLLNCSHIITDAIRIDTEIKLLWVGARRNCTQGISAFDSSAHRMKRATQRSRAKYFTQSRSIVTITAIQLWIHTKWAHDYMLPMRTFALSQLLIFFSLLVQEECTRRVCHAPFASHMDRLMCKWCNEHNMYVKLPLVISKSACDMILIFRFWLLHRCHPFCYLHHYCIVELTRRDPTRQQTVLHFMCSQHSIQHDTYAKSHNRVDSSAQPGCRVSRLRCTLDVQSLLNDTLAVPSLFALLSIHQYSQYGSPNQFKSLLLAIGENNAQCNMAAALFATFWCFF